jgi:hypothetical protein
MNNLISKAKKLMLNNPNEDFDILAERFISQNKSINEDKVIDAFSMAHDLISE